MYFTAKVINSNKNITNQLDLIDYYDDIPYIDQNGIYFINKLKSLPNMKKYDKKLVLYSSIFYSDTMVLIFKKNGEKDYVLLDELLQNIQFHDISVDDNPLLEFQNADFVEKLKETILDNNYHVLGVISPINNKKEKELVFKCQYNKKIYIVITKGNSLRFTNPIYFDKEKLNSVIDIESIPYIYKRKLNQNEEEVIFVSNELHKHGECQTVFINKDKKKIPETFKFYFYICRVNTKLKKIVKIQLETNDCPITNNSKQIV